MARITEGEIADVIVRILSDKASGEATIQDLIREIPKWVTLSPEDRAPSSTRSGEELWEQQVRNITSHKDNPGNAVYEGRLVAIPSGLRLARRAAA